LRIGIFGQLIKESRIELSTFMVLEHSRELLANGRSIGKFKRDAAEKAIA
jgi:hypothetical protein